MEIKPDWGCDGGLFLRSHEVGQSYQVQINYLPNDYVGGISGEGLGPNGTTIKMQPAPDWETSYEQVRKHMLQAFAETYSLSLQQTLYEMGSRIIDRRDEIDEVRFSLPNKHHFLVDLQPFGLENDNEVYYAADRPYGLIEATVLRDGCEARIPVDLTNL
jgi:hypothetical protein